MMSEHTKEQIISLEKEWMEGWRRKDRETCARILADDFIITSATGAVLNKQQWLDNIIGPFECEEFIWERVNVRLYDKAAIVNAVVKQQAEIYGADWSGIFLLTDVWIQRDGNWNIVSRQGTGPFPEEE